MTICMQVFNPKDLEKLYIPKETSHKGQNGKLMVIGEYKLFHAASLWSMEVATRIVDMVFYSSVPENNEIVLSSKKDWQGGIVVPRESLENYIEEADAILLGPGMVRTDKKIQDTNHKIQKIQEIDKIQDEGEQTYFLTKYLLEKYPNKKWIIDAGVLQ